MNLMGNAHAVISLRGYLSEEEALWKPVEDALLRVFAVNSVQTGWNNAVDSAKNFIGTKIEEISDKLSSNNGTFTRKICINANALLGVYVDIGYDGMGRLSEKSFPEGMRTLWHYDGRGQLTELLHEDDRGTLDRYRYEYDLMGKQDCRHEGKEGPAGGQRTL